MHSPATMAATCPDCRKRVVVEATLAPIHCTCDQEAQPHVHMLATPSFEIHGLVCPALRRQRKQAAHGARVKTRIFGRRICPVPAKSVAAAG